jgi:NTE family protein
VDLAVGWNRQPWSRFSLGLEGKIGSVEIQNLTNADADASAWGPYIRFEHDTLDSRYFPYQGSTGTSRVATPTSSRPRGRASEQAEGVNYRLVMIKPWSWDRHSLNLMLEGGGSSSRRRYRCSCRIWAGCSACPASSITS